MIKLLAVVNIVAWAGFWAFGYLALSSDGPPDAQLLTASLLAALGLFTGVFTYLRLVRVSELTGYARPSAQMNREIRNEVQKRWGERHELG